MLQKKGPISSKQVDCDGHNTYSEGCRSHGEREQAGCMGCMGCTGKASGHGICMYMHNLPLEGTVEVKNKEQDKESMEKIWKRVENNLDTW